MEKIINVNGKDYKFKATGATPIYYSQLFGGDMLVDMQKLVNAFQASEGEIPPKMLDVFGKIAYTMNRQGDPDNVPGEYIEWIDGLEIFDIYDVLPKIIEMWQLNSETHSKAKKEGGQ